MYNESDRKSFSDGGKCQRARLDLPPAYAPRESGLLKAEPGFSCCRRIPMRRRAAFAFRDFYQWQKHTEIQKYSLQIQGRSDFAICVRRKEHARIEICYSRIAESEEHERI